MPINTHRPVTPAQRGMTSQDMSEITAKRPLRSLTRVKKITSGRNNQGRITTRHRGGGVRRFYRIVNFNLPLGTTATVEAIEYDPNRSARIARIKDANGNYHYIIASKNLSVGSTIHSAEEAPIEHGNRLPIKNIPVGSVIHAIELQPGRGAQMVRSAGASAQLMAKEDGLAQVKLPSGEVRIVSIDCTASLGSVGNDQHQNVKLGKAGRVRKLGFRPTVRGMAMNAADHPHGGGEGRGKGGGHPRSPWGWKTIGYKTRTRKKSNKFIAKSRHESKRK